MWISGGIAPRILNLVSKMKVNITSLVHESHRYPSDRADLKKEPAGSSETLESVYQTERRHSPEYRFLENYLPLPGTKYHSPDHLCRSVVTILTELTRVTLIFHLQLYVCFRDSAAQRRLWPPHSRGFLITHNDAP
jgi:hypothetical protein